MAGNPFHEGEIAVQRRAGESPMAERNGAVIGNKIPRGALAFVRQQPLAVAGARDINGRPWASLLLGKPGFLDPDEDGRSLRIHFDAAARRQSALFRQSIAATRMFGMLIIDLGSRRRLRINGRAASISADELLLNVDEAYPNCPKYIQRRSIRPGPQDTPLATRPQREGTVLDPELTALVRNADTFFVASAHRSHGVDVSHRGGDPGFVQVIDPATLKIPDYPGNSMFNTLGNLALNPNAGLVFPDFEGHRILQLTGATEILWEQSDEANETAGTRRFWRFHVRSWLETPILIPLASEFLDYSRFNPRIQAIRASPV